MKKLFKQSLSGSSILLISIFLVNIINFIFNAYLGRVLSFEDFGLVALINTMWYVAMIAFNALYGTVNYRSAYLIAKYNTQAGYDFLSATNKKNILITFVISCLWLLCIPFIDSFFQINDYLIPLLFTPVIMLGVIVAADKGFLQGNFNFKAVAFILLLESISKLFFAWFFVSSHMSYWVYASIPLSVGISFIIARWVTSQKATKTIKAGVYKFPKRFFTAILITGLSSMAILTFDVLLAKHYLTPTEAGQYALLSLIGKMVYFLGALPGVLIITYVSNDRGKNINPIRSFYKLLFATVILSMGSFLSLGLLGHSIVPFLFGQKTLVILPYLNTYAGAISLFAISSTIISYHLVKQQYLFSLIGIFMAILMSVGIILNHSSITEIVSVILSVSMMSFIVICLLHILEVKNVPLAMKYMKTL